MTKPGRHSRHVNCLDKSPAGVMAEPVWMHMLYVGSSPQLGDRVVDAARDVGATVAAEGRASYRASQQVSHALNGQCRGGPPTLCPTGWRA